MYIAAVDDYIRAFLQVVAYYQYLKGGIGSMGPSREELKLRSAQRRAQRIGDPSVIQSTLLSMLGVDKFCTRDPYHEGAKVFGSQKHKLNTPIGVDEDSHRPDTVNFSQPCPPKRVTRSYATTLSTIVQKVEGSVEQLHASPPSGTDIRHVIAVQESNINEWTWHIARIPKTSAKTCWAQMAITKKKYTAWIVLHGKNTLAPTYSSLWQNIRFNHEEHMQFFFCSDDIERYVKDSRHKSVIPYSDTLERPPIPTIWPVKIGIDLTHSEIVALKNVGFQLPQRERITPNRLFTNSASPLDLSTLQVPENPQQYRGTRKSKSIRRSNSGPSSKQLLNINSAKAMQASIFIIISESLGTTHLAFQKQIKKSVEVCLSHYLYLPS